MPCLHLIVHWNGATDKQVCSINDSVMGSAEAPFGPLCSAVYQGHASCVP